MKTILLPIFRLSQLLPYHETRTPSIEEVFQENIVAAIKSFESRYPKEDVVMICVREKDDDGDYKMSICCAPLNEPDIKDIFVKSHSYKKFKNMVFNIEDGIMQAVDRMVKLLPFA